MLEDEMIGKTKLDTDKLLKYGFDNNLSYSKNIMNNELKVILSFKKKLTGKIIDLNSNEEYLLFRTNYLGEYSSMVRNEYISLIKDILDKCSINENNQKNRIIKYIDETYKCKGEYPWGLDSHIVFKNKKTEKWFGLIMEVDRNKFSNNIGIVNIMNLKINPKTIDELVKIDGYYRAYHMNKKYWITICLDDSIDDIIIHTLIDESYSYSIKK